MCDSSDRTPKKTNLYQTCYPKKISEKSSDPKNKRDFSKPKKIRISKISDPKNKPSPPVNFFSSTLPGVKLMVL